jgi:hypothetical protein
MTYCVFEPDPSDSSYLRCTRGGCNQRLKRVPNVPLDRYHARCRGDGPGIVQKAANLAKATAKHVATGAKTVSDEVALRRSSICEGCNLFVKQNGSGYCSHKTCGCQTVGAKEFMAKQRWADSVCPHPKGNNWAMTDEQLAACGHPDRETMK